MSICLDSEVWNNQRQFFPRDFMENYWFFAVTCDKLVIYIFHTVSPAVLYHSLQANQHKTIPLFTLLNAWTTFMDGLQSNLLHCRWIRIISHSPTNNKSSATLSLLHTFQNSLAAWGTSLMLLGHPFIVNLWACCNTWSDLVAILNSVFCLSETDKLLVKVCTAGSASSELSSLTFTDHMYVVTPSALDS